MLTSFFAIVLGALRWFARGPRRLTPAPLRAGGVAPAEGPRGDARI